MKCSLRSHSLARFARSFLSPSVSRGGVPSPPPSISHGWGPAPPTLARGVLHRPLICVRLRSHCFFFVTGAPAPFLTMRVHVLLSRYRSQHGRPLHPASVGYSRVRLLSTYQPTACYFLRISPQPATIVIAFTEVGSNPHVCYISGINPHVCYICRYQPARTLRPLCVRLRDSDFNCALPSGPRSAFSSALRTDLTTCLFSICGSIPLASLAPLARSSTHLQVGGGSRPRSPPYCTGGAPAPPPSFVVWWTVL